MTCESSGRNFLGLPCLAGRLDRLHVYRVSIIRFEGKIGFVRKLYGKGRYKPCYLDACNTGISRTEYSLTFFCPCMEFSSGPHTNLFCRPVQMTWEAWGAKFLKKWSHVTKRDRKRNDFVMFMNLNYSQLSMTYLCVNTKHECTQFTTWGLLQLSNAYFLAKYLLLQGLTSPPPLAA